MGHLPDAAPGGDAASSPVTLTVTNAGVPRVGVHVYFLAADGTPIATVDTGADGTASAVMAAAGSVTAIDAFPSNKPTFNGLFTFMAVKPGTHLVLADSDRTTAAFTLTAKGATDATNYDVFTTCGTQVIAPDPAGGPTASGMVSLKGCHGAADIAILASKFDRTTQVSTPLSGLFHAGAAIPATGALNLTDDYAGLTAVSFAYSNAPAGEQLEVEHAPILRHGQLGPFDLTLQDGAGSMQEPTTTAASSVVLMAQKMALGTRKVIDWGPLPPAYALDLTGVLLPDMLGRPSYDFTAGKVVWSEAAQGATPDALITVIEATRTAPARDWTWFVLAPYNKGELVLPRLPTDVGSFIPITGDTASIDHVSLVKLTGGYDALLARPIDIGENDLALAAGPSGHFITMESLNSSGLRARAPAADRRPARRAVFGIPR